MNTSDKSREVEQPDSSLFKIICSIICGIGFVCLGSIFIYESLHTITLECTRSGGGVTSCRVQKKFLDKQLVQEVSIRNPKGAYLETDCDEDGCSYSIFLSSDFGPIRLSPISDPFLGEKEVLVDQINKYIEHADQFSLDVEIKSNPITPILVGLFPLFGIYLLFLASKGKSFL